MPDSTVPWMEAVLFHAKRFEKMPIHFADQSPLILTSISDSDIPIDLRNDFSAVEFERALFWKKTSPLF